MTLQVYEVHDGHLRGSGMLKCNVIVAQVDNNHEVWSIYSNINKRVTLAKNILDLFQPVHCKPSLNPPVEKLEREKNTHAFAKLRS